MFFFIQIINLGPQFLNPKLKIQNLKSNKITIRPLKPEDSIEEITLLLHASYKKLADMGFRYLATHQDNSETERRLKNGMSYLALSGKKIIATITLYLNAGSHSADWYKKKEVAHFGQFAVMPEYQFQGIGNSMMDLIERKAFDLGAKELALDTAEGASHLIKYYEQRGYRFIEYVDWKVTNYRSVVMSKKLSGKK